MTVRWPAHPFTTGDKVLLVEINERNVPREVRGTNAKRTIHATFDERGSLLPIP